MHQTHSLTRIASAVVAARRFVDITGAHAANAQAAIGISEQPAAVGEAFTALTYYSAPVEASEALAVGDLVKPATDGSGRAAKGDSSAYCGRVIEAASGAGKFAEVRFLEGGGAGAGAVAGAFVSTVPYASAAALEAAFPAASNNGKQGLVGAAAPYVIYVSNGTAWLQSGSSGGGSVAQVPAAFASRALTDADLGTSLICAAAQIATVNTGRVSGFWCQAKGLITFAGTATINDLRTTGAANPWCQLIQTAVDTYDVVGSKP